MIVLDCEQGTEEWFAARLGIPTASEYGKILTSTGKPSTSAKTYMHALLADWYVGRPVDQTDPTIWMQRGSELEDTARSLYEMQTDQDVEQVGFCLRDDKLTGCSPDGFAGEGLLEIKCPKAGTLIGYRLGDKLPAVYVPQVQGQLWITEREWCDFFCYHPDLPPFQVRVYRDEEYIKNLSAEVESFIEKMLAMRDKLRG